jgi:hypothetical protein
MGGFSATVGHSKVPTWHTLWAQINRRVDRLGRIYAGTHELENTGYLEDEVDALLLCIWSLHDWLLADDEVGPQFAAKIKDVTDRDPLALCGDYADSFKHHTYRAKRARRYARLHETTASLEGVTCSFQYWMTDGSGVDASVDALQFARQCIAEWRAFFSTHGIRDPEPRFA